jgi:hypothetical protein
MGIILAAGDNVVVWLREWDREEIRYGMFGRRIWIRRWLRFEI